jgi:hypothetical protein
MTGSVVIVASLSLVLTYEWVNEHIGESAQAHQLERSKKPEHQFLDSCRLKAAMR